MKKYAWCITILLVLASTAMADYPLPPEPSGPPPAFVTAGLALLQAAYLWWKGVLS
jgi:hypothetical protein